MRPKKMPGGVGEGDGPVALFFQQGVGDPEGAVDGGDEGLQPWAGLAVEVGLDLGDVGDVHADGGEGGDDGQDFHLFFGHIGFLF